MRKIAWRWLLTMALLAGLISGGATPAWCADQNVLQKVLVLPPTLNGSPDMAYLKQGLVDMLTSRLADPGKVAVIPAGDLMVPEGRIDRAMALDLASRAGVDHVVYGSLTILGSSISTDLQMADAATGEAQVSFSRSGKDPSALIEHVDLFAAETNRNVFGRKARDDAAARPSAAPGTGAAPADTVYQHPEKLLQQPMVVDGQGRYGADGYGAVIIGAGSAVRGPRVDGQVQGVTIGDVDGDGRPEAVIAGRSTLWIYRFVNGRFAKMATIDGSGNYIGVDTADLDDNGKDEIFVTNFDNNDGRVISFVLEYDGKKFERRAELMNYYFRAMNVPMRGRVIFGQRQALDALFQPGIYEMVWEGGEYRRGSRLKVPRGQNIFGMGLGTMPPSPEQMIFAYNSATQMAVSDHVGNQEWVSSNGYGTAATLVQTESKEDLSGRGYQYLAGRIEIVDLDTDGTNEAVVLSNEDLSSNVFKRTRLFKHGRLEILKIDELGMSARLRTRFLPKFISDFAVGDMDRDGKPEILAAVVQKLDNMVGKGRTSLFMFRLDGLAETGANPK